jgi:hypothetical protein
MLRPRPFAVLVAALSLLACALVFAPIGATQSGQPTLSQTPPVPLAPASSTTTTTTTSGQPAGLPKTGLDAWLVALLGGCLVVIGARLRQAVARPASRRRG